MNEETLQTWQGIKGILHRMTEEQRETDPWVSFFLAQAIYSVGKGEPNLSAIEMAQLPATERHAHDFALSAAAKVTTAELRAAFESLPVPGGRPT